MAAGENRAGPERVTSFVIPICLLASYLIN